MHMFGGKSRDSFANFGHCCPFFLQRLILDAEVTGYKETSEAETCFPSPPLLFPESV